MCVQLALTALEGIILGTHHEKGAFTFWSYAIGLPLPSSAILSWKFCHVLHKVLRDGHPNVSVPSAMSLLLHWQGEISGSCQHPSAQGVSGIPSLPQPPFPGCGALCCFMSLKLAHANPPPLGATGRLELLPELQWCKGLDPFSSPASGHTASPAVPHLSLFLSPGSPGLPEVPQQHPRDGGPVGEWGGVEDCASQRVWRWLLRNLWAQRG